MNLESRCTTRRCRLTPALAVLGLYLIATSAGAQEVTRARLDSLMTWSNAIGVFNGNVLVAQRGEIVFAGSYGYAGASRTTRLMPGHRFNIGSITKEFSAVALMMLQEQGKLETQDKVSRFISELPAWAHQVSLRNLLDYTSGLPELRWNTIKNDADAFADLQRVDSLGFPPGTRFDYSNNNVELRQFVVERITGETFNSFAASRQFARCDMTSSVMNPGQREPDIARSFSDDLVGDPTDMPISGVAFVTATDLLKWANCLHEHRLVTARSIYELGHSFRPSNGGLGETVFRDSVLVTHRHDGQSRNYEALLDADLSRNTTIVLLSNNKHFKLRDIATAINAILKGETAKLPKKSVGQFLSRAVDSLPIASFIERYESLRRTRSAELEFDDEEDLNSFGYRLMGRKRLEDAVQLFLLNVRRFPSSPNVYDSLGEAYLAQGDARSALLAYEKVLALQPNNTNAKQMIEKIRSMKP